MMNTHTHTQTHTCIYVDKSLTIFESIETQGFVRGQYAMSQGLCWFSCITDSLVGAHINNII